MPPFSLMILLVVACALFVDTVLSNDLVTVETIYGRVDGFKYNVFGGRSANVFLGVPFAKPPIGELRFEKPEPPDPWSDPLDATKFAPACTPHHRSGILGEHSEDCLYLNIMAPAEESENPAGHAVMVWIHGGGYSLGSAEAYGYANISENFVARDVIVVTVQYRLGPYGWLSNGDSVLRGNFGYWDQRAALRFIKENIASFGGDPNKITLFGLSAGGGSVSSLSLSPYTRDLFAQTIEMSGSAFAPWAASDSVVHSTTELALKLGCQIADSNELKSCLKEKTSDEFFDAVDAIGSARRSPNILKFGPWIDGDFFPEDFEKLVDNSPKKPTVIGLVNKESAFFTTEGNLKPINELLIAPENYEAYGDNNLIDFIRDVIAPEDIFGHQTAEVRDELTKHYVKRDEPTDKDYRFYLDRYTELVSDIAFNIPCIRMKDAKVASGWPVWFYFNDHYNIGAFKEDAPVKGATHLHEYPYMFGISPFYDFVFNDDEMKLQRAILETFTHFAKYGAPGNEEYPWEPITLEHNLRHMRFGPESKMRNTFLEENIAFWESMKKYDYDIIRGVRRSRTFEKEEL
uniref:Carboxylic ester hydrolase n=2 Tax=Parascaris univalens TaxID=6257 RepID=A0A915BM32_PARUN